VIQLPKSIFPVLLTTQNSCFENYATIIKIIVDRE